MRPPLGTALVIALATAALPGVIASCSSGPQEGSLCPLAYDPPRPSAEAEQIGLEMLGAQGPLLLADAVYERVVRDLALIRGARPELADQEHLGLWLPNRVSSASPTATPSRTSTKPTPAIRPTRRTSSIAGTSWTCPAR